MIPYDDLLRIFWAEHDPAYQPWSRQYMSIILPADEEQFAIAMASRDREAARHRSVLHTEIAPPGAVFWQAEDYHQKYYLRHHQELMGEFMAIYPKAGDLVASTAAARVNGLLGGHGGPELVAALRDTLGLSPEVVARLADTVGNRRRYGLAGSF